MKRVCFCALAFFVTALLIASPAMTQPPDGKQGKGGQKGAATRLEIGQVLPPQLVDELKLTPEQQKELDAIQKDVKARLEKLLNAEQLKTIENFRPAGQSGAGEKGSGKGTNRRRRS